MRFVNFLNYCKMYIQKPPNSKSKFVSLYSFLNLRHVFDQQHLSSQYDFQAHHYQLFE